jgi:hypothetical protein
VSSGDIKSVGEDNETLSEESKDSDDVLRSWIVYYLYNISKNDALDPTTKVSTPKLNIVSMNCMIVTSWSYFLILKTM